MPRGYNMDYENYTEVGADSVYELGENGCFIEFPRMVGRVRASEARLSTYFAELLSRARRILELHKLRNSNKLRDIVEMAL